MLELLILYSLNKTELTLYSLRKYIIQNYGELLSPSNGSIHPALTRLMNKKLVEKRQKISSGGKMYTFYSVTGDYKDYFNKQYVNICTNKTESLEHFLHELNLKLIVSDFVESSLFQIFKEKSLAKLEFYKDLLEKKFNNNYIEINDIQKGVLKSYLKRINDCKSLIENVI